MKPRFAVLTVILATSLPAASFAGGLEALSLDSSLAFGSAVASEIGRIEPRDAFVEIEACRIADAKTLREVSLEEARDMLQPCARALAAAYGVTVAIEPGAVGPLEGGRGAALGLQIQLGRGAGVTSAANRDLQYALERRGGEVLGHPVRVVREQGMRAMVQSSLQDPIDRCILPTVLRRMETSEDFLKAYWGCLSKTRDLRLKGIQPSPRGGRSLAVVSEAGAATVAAMNGWISVPGPAGRVSFEIEAQREAVFHILPVR